ncbi:histidine kinase [Aeromicrobium sp. CF4.19]|uniref:sensor histidine kinase n=1 Tax=Aeromicrobium sp. CF4.19 TaxID=3373082 RepID=UPI003EE61148
MRDTGVVVIDWTRPVGPLRPQPVSAEGMVERLRLTGISAGFAVMAVPSLLLGALAVLSVLAAPIGLGLAVALGVVPAAQKIAAAHRAVSAMLLGEQIPAASYRDVGELSPMRRPLTWARERARWRDVAGLWFRATGGFVLSLLPVALLAVPTTFLLMGVTADASGLVLAVVLGGPAAVVWWLSTPALVKARALAERRILIDPSARLAARVSEVEETRAETLDHSAAEIRRIERDLHDGAQARIAAVGMSVGLAEKLMGTDPDAAATLLREARQSTVSALEDLRGVVRGIMPPVLADKGLSEAIEALVASLPLHVTVDLPLPRLPQPIESAAYFAVAECLANAVKHAEASTAFVHGSHDGTRLRLVVGDDGRGGAVADGGGLTGLARRLAAFDGTVAVNSPLGGPTEITMELPCQV